MNRLLINTISLLYFSIGLLHNVTGQSGTLRALPTAQTLSALSVAFDPDKQVVTRHRGIFNNQRIAYQATTGTLPVYDKNHRLLAGLFFTYYQKTGAKEGADRPLVFLFNGGPGSSSVWLQMGYTGPKVVNLDPEGFPVQPYGYSDNPFSVLDVADLVFVNTVNTAYSRKISEQVSDSLFFRQGPEITYLASWIHTFLNRFHRWGSPKFLLGESYGGVRVAELASTLQNDHFIFMNGVVLVSPADLGLGPEQLRNNVYQLPDRVDTKRTPEEAAQALTAVKRALAFPHLAAVAWYHHQLPDSLQQKDLPSLLKEMEQIATQELLPAFGRMTSLTLPEKEKLAARMAPYTGLSTSFILNKGLLVSSYDQGAELFKKEGLELFNLDARFKQAAGGMAHTPEQSFAPAINMYLEKELTYRSELNYILSATWWVNDRILAGAQLRLAMQQNPFMKVLVQSGYYDGVCDYFNTRMSLKHLDRLGRLKNRIRYKGYEAGHMMYVVRDIRKAANSDLRAFILEAAYPSGKPH